jgi:hypothetical protein
MTSPTVAIGSRKSIRCNTCNWQTNHELRAIQISHNDDADGDYDRNNPFSQPSWWIDTEYRLWACLGCDTAVLEIVEIYNGIGYQSFSTYYPSRKSDHLVPKHFVQLDKKLQAIYREIIESYNAQLKITCSMGLRALIEGICIDKGITDKDAFGLEAKLGKLGEKGLMPNNIVDSLYSFKFIGDDAAHRLEAPSQQELKLAIDVMEDLLNFLYEMEYKLAAKAQELGNKRITQITEIKNKKSAKISKP